MPRDGENSVAEGHAAPLAGDNVYCPFNDLHIRLLHPLCRSRCLDSAVPQRVLTLGIS